MGKTSPRSPLGIRLRYGPFWKGHSASAGTQPGKQHFQTTWIPSPEFLPPHLQMHHLSERLNQCRNQGLLPPHRNIGRPWCQTWPLHAPVEAIPFFSILKWSLTWRSILLQCFPPNWELTNSRSKLRADTVQLQERETDNYPHMIHIAETGAEETGVGRQNGLMN